jgi:UDP-N-acetyl-D-mannosaminuronic acid dehydrogenase
MIVKKNSIPKRVCVIGIGYIGLPTACILATSGYTVLGIDTDEEVINRVQFTRLSEPEPGLQKLLVTAIKSGNFKTANSIEPADIHIIAVPTPLDESNRADLSYINTVLKALKKHLRPNDLVIIESTCPIGATLTFAANVRKTCSGVQVAYCPERVLPGNIIHELIYNDRIVGGVDDTSTLRAASFYRSFIKGKVLTTDANTAEAVKLAENTFRDINIAYANELSMIADRIGLDVNEIISLANRHPRVKILKPGPGVGGHCLAIDPWFLVSAAPDLALITSKAREINLKKVDWVINKIKKAIKKHNIKVLACLGLSYKPNTSDIRESPALVVIQALKKDAEVLPVDPYVPNTEPLKSALLKADAVIGLVAHDVFRNIPKSLIAGKLILDFAGVFE